MTEMDDGGNTEAITKRELPEALRVNLWQKGQSGNPSGRPKKKPITEAYEALLNDPVRAKEVAEAMLAMVLKQGKNAVQAAKELADRVDGPAAQSLELTGKDGGPIEFMLRRVGDEAK